MRSLVLMGAAIVLSGCATLTEDAMVPVALSFGDGSSGHCMLDNKRGRWEVDVPGSASVRRSDDPLKYQCNSDRGGDATGSIPSTMGAKIIASAVFIDLGITDAITDMHREYPASYVVPMGGKKIAKAPAGATHGVRYRSQADQVAESMMCTESATMTESTSESEKWVLDCGDGESLELRCFEDTCYVRQ